MLTRWVAASAYTLEGGRELMNAHMNWYFISCKILSPTISLQFTLGTNAWQEPFPSLLIRIPCGYRCKVSLNFIFLMDSIG